MMSWSCARNIFRAPQRVPLLVTYQAKVNRVRPPLEEGYTLVVLAGVYYSVINSWSCSNDFNFIS